MLLPVRGVRGGKGRGDETVRNVVMVVVVQRKVMALTYSIIHPHIAAYSIIHPSLYLMVVVVQRIRERSGESERARDERERESARGRASERARVRGTSESGERARDEREWRESEGRARARGSEAARGQERARARESERARWMGATCRTRRVPPLKPRGAAAAPAVLHTTVTQLLPCFNLNVSFFLFLFLLLLLLLLLTTTTTSPH